MQLCIAIRTVAQRFYNHVIRAYPEKIKRILVIKEKNNERN